MGSTKSKKVILTLALNSESDVLLARRRARQIASLLGFNNQDQTRITTAVSEIVRNAHIHANGGRVELCIDDTKNPFTFTIVVRDKGSGIPEGAVSPKSDQLTGLNGARQLVDTLTISPAPGGGTIVQLDKILAGRSAPFSASEIDQLSNSLTKIVSTNPLDEVHQQNQELIIALDDLSKHKNQVDQLNLELRIRNGDLARLYIELQELNNSLELKVDERTSELIQVNDDLRRARDEAIQANILKSQFVANISHEIRTPMSGILGLSELLVNETEGETKVTAEYINSSASNLMVLVNDLLDMSKLEAGKFEIIKEVFQLNELVENVLTAFDLPASNQNLELLRHVDESLKEDFIGAPGRIRQVLQNLIQNAFKFTDKGSVKVLVEPQKVDGSTVYVRFSVSDTGPGISEVNQGKLFQLFVQVDGSTTRKHGGTGLGLALSKKLVQLMNGVISIDSVEGAGSTFWFTIPLTRGSEL